MRGADPMAMVVTVGMVVAASAVVLVGPGREPVGGSGQESVRGPVPALRQAAFDPASFRLGYVSRDRLTLAETLPGGGTGAALGEAAGDADFDADARAGALVWVSRRTRGDGAHLDGDLFIRRTSGLVTRLTNDAAVDRHPALSPDGRRVAFTSDRGGSDDIWVLNVAGGPPRRLTNHPAADSWPTWSPDGKRLAFSSTRDDPAGEIYTMSATGGQPVRLTTDPAADTEPAWSPDGTKIAFTTTRFRVTAGIPPVRSAPQTDVVTMPATGGPVTAEVPPPLDSAKAAWAPNSRQLAFVSYGSDPSGDVYMVDGLSVVPIATGAARAEQDPTWRDVHVVYTSTDVGTTTNVWSADDIGGDRRDHTARRWTNESGPAYTADGSRLAYSAEMSDGSGERIVVADADGRNAQVIAPPGTERGDRDADPVWSPDGSMLAFSRFHPWDPEGGRDGGNNIGPNDQGADGSETPRSVDGQPLSRVLVVRVADGALLGGLPVPAHLDGDDEQPAWSSDGTRLAVARRAIERFSRINPPRVDQPLRPDEFFNQATSVDVPEIPAAPEIVFFLDSTGSMVNVIESLKSTIVGVVRRVQQSQPNARFALVAYGAHEQGELNSGRYYRRLSDLTGGAGADQRLAEALQPLRAENGGEEGWYNALVQAFSGDDAHRVHLRPGSSPIPVLIGDAPSTGNTRYPPGGDVPPVTQEEVINLLTAEGVRARLVAVPVRGSGELGLDWDDPDPDGIGEATEIATATGGVVTATTNDDEVAEAVVRGITSTRVKVIPTVERCDQGLGVTFDPTQVEIVSGQQANFTVRIKLGADARSGAVLRCAVTFDVGSAVPTDEIRQHITIRVSDRERPFVRVDDVTVRATGPTGARVDYWASAVSSTGIPLSPPTCTPPSGSVFPIGQTLVTCTSSVGGGPTGQDVAVINVVDPTTHGRRIWVADIAKTAPDQVTFGNQRDLSARVGAPCPARGNSESDPGDRAPAWSPDSTKLAFTTDSDGHPPGLCVVNADGSDARMPVREADQADQALADPAWSPDGRQIAIVRTPTKEQPVLLTVPATGGPATVVVHTVGGAIQPAYRMLPGRDLAVTASVAGQPAYLGGDAIPVTFTIRNTSPRPATNVFLSPAVPTELTPPSRVDQRCDGVSVCRLGELGVNAQTMVTIMLPTHTAISTTVSVRVTATVGDRAPITRRASVPVVVKAPTLAVDPPIGPPGFVTRAIGSEFPPGAVVRVTWEVGITATPDTVEVGPDGTFDIQQLVMRKDALGPRFLRAEWVSGIRFGPVRAGEAFLVVPRQLDPPFLGGRS